MARKSRANAYGSSIARRTPVWHNLMVDPSLDDVLSDLSVWEDRRQYHPEGPLRRASSFLLGDGQVVDRSQVRNERTEAPFFSGHVGFANPDRVWICARRKVRREVLMALTNGRGGSSRKKRRNYWSNVRC